VLFLTPFFTYAILIAFLAYWVVVYAFMITTGEAVEDVNGHARFRDSEESNFTEMFWYHLFGLFWGSQFILACAQLAMAGAIATWYFTRDRKTLSFTFLKSVWRVIRYHLGTAAFGSLIIAFVQFLRAILTYVERKTKDRTGVIVELVLKCCMCCLWCLEKCLKFLNKNAYIETAIFGYNFCTAARRAFSLLLANILRVAVLNFMTGFIVFVIKLFVVAVVGCVAYYWIQNNSDLEDDLNYWGVLVFFICIVAFIISDIFLNVYDMTIDTLFLCFAEDSDRNDGKTKPYFMSDSLAKFMKSQGNTVEEKKEEKKAAEAE